MATSHGAVLLPNHAAHRLPLPHQLILFVQLLAAPGDGPIWRPAGRLSLHAALQLDLLRHHWIPRRFPRKRLHSLDRIWKKKTTRWCVYCWFIAVLDGSDGAERSVHLVPAEQGHNRELLVWDPIQSHVPAVGATAVQPRHRRRWHHGVCRHRRWTPLLLLGYAVPARVRWTHVAQHAANSVRSSLFAHGLHRNNGWWFGLYWWN